MECKKEKNIINCKCSYEPCEKKGICCECIAYHIKRKELPACFFSEKTEKTFDRSFQKFIEDNVRYK